MNRSEDPRWQNLISLSAPTFAGEASPPYGLTTRTLARLRGKTREQELLEKIGMRALFASLSVLLVTAGIALGVGYSNRSDLDPGLRNMVQIENVPIS